MTDTAAPQLTPAMCELADAQYGMITLDQAEAAGVADLPAALVAASLAEKITNTVIRLRAGAHHPHPQLYAAWLSLDVLNTPTGREAALTGVASHSTALVLYGLTPNYSPLYEFTLLGPEDGDEHQEEEETPEEEEPIVDDVFLHWESQAPQWQIVSGIPTTTPAATIVDFCARLGDDDALIDLAHDFVEHHHIEAKQLHDDLIEVITEFFRSRNKSCPDLNKPGSFPDRLLRSLLDT